MNKIFTIGESVYDIIFSSEKIMEGKAGGSMLNASVSLARMGLDVNFITELGNDELGEIIINFLKQNNVGVEYIQHFSDGKTPVALAFLDNLQNATYSFYKQYPVVRLQQTFPEINENDIVLFGSFFSVSPAVSKRVVEFVKGAKNAGAIIIYDPNIRHPKSHDIKKILPLISENLALADIVRASHEDFNSIFGITNPKQALEIIWQHGDADLIYTHSSQFVFLGAHSGSKFFPVPTIKVVSTIGAGDNFNAGIIYALHKNRVSRKDVKNLDENTWMNIIDSGIQFSQAVCRSLDNYVPLGFKS